MNKKVLLDSKNDEQKVKLLYKISKKINQKIKNNKKDTTVS